MTAVKYLSDSMGNGGAGRGRIFLALRRPMRKALYAAIPHTVKFIIPQLRACQKEIVAAGPPPLAKVPGWYNISAGPVIIQRSNFSCPKGKILLCAANRKENEVNERGRAASPRRSSGPADCPWREKCLYLKLYRMHLEGTMALLGWNCWWNWRGDKKRRTRGTMYLPLIYWAGGREKWVELGGQSKQDGAEKLCGMF